VPSLLSLLASAFDLPRYDPPIRLHGCTQVLPLCASSRIQRYDSANRGKARWLPVCAPCLHLLQRGLGEGAHVQCSWEGTKGHRMWTCGQHKRSDEKAPLAPFHRERTRGKKKQPKRAVKNAATACSPAERPIRKEWDGRGVAIKSHQIKIEK
jgi:hypothetical protein